MNKVIEDLNLPDSSLVMLSGGIGSAVLLAYAKIKNLQNIEALFLSYHECSICEEKSARELARFYGIKLKIIDVSAIYWDMMIKKPSDKFNQLNDFYIPYRNGVLVSIAAAVAYNKRLENIIWGVSMTSGMYYSDCSVRFTDYQKWSLILGTYAKSKLITPFLFKSKSEIFELGKVLKVPFEFTWSCIESNRQPCGRCFGCIERSKLGL